MIELYDRSGRSLMGRCDGCHKRVIWLRHEASGKSAPVDPEIDQGGNVVVDLAAGTYSVLGPSKRAEAAGRGVELHMPHHATCPRAGRFRRRA